jgi:hypothetical protein
MSKSFELFSVAFARTSQQHVRTTFSVQQVKRFLSKTQIWEESYNRSDDVLFRLNTILDKASRAEDVQMSGQQSPLSERSYLVMEIAYYRSASVRMLGQYHPDAALFKKKFQRIWKVGCIVIHPNASATVRVPPRGNRLRIDLGLM